jgi:hypothetical protein
MRKLLTSLAVIAGLALPAGGCATFGDITGIPSSVLTTTINNPVTKNDLADVERAYQAALGVANVYVELCRNRQIARASCRPVVERIQGYVGQAHAALVQLRLFVRNNDTVNALSAIVAARAAIAGFQASSDYQAITAATATH